MSELNKGELLKAILAAVEKYPNTKVSKLIKSVESEKNHKNIVLLLIDLAEHPEFSADVSISLKYYLDMFEELPEEPSFSEAGLLILNSAIIYGKRVENVHLTVERLIMSLINAENIGGEPDDLNTHSTPKIIKRGKKRPLEHLNGPYESDMNAKRFKTISTSKRFDESCLNSSKKTSYASIERDPLCELSKGIIHPTVWKYSAIEDYDYDDEIDSKRHYKLFTYHLEHRYNTLIPDINFKMYFKIKDFIGEECSDSALVELWPPLSAAYIEHYVNLENHILNKEGHDAKNQYITEKRAKYNMEHVKSRFHEELRNISSIHRQSQVTEDSQNSLEENVYKNFSLNERSRQNQYIDESNASVHEDINAGTGIGLEIYDNTLNQTLISIEANKDSHSPDEQPNKDVQLKDSAIDCSTFMQSRTVENITENKSNNDDSLSNKALNKTEYDSTLLNSKFVNEDLTTVKVILPHLDDEGVFFSDLDERDQQMLSPAVVATDVFRCVKDKSNIVVIVDDIIKRIYNIEEPARQVLSLPVFSCQESPSLRLNILKIQHKYLKKRQTFKLSSDFHLLKKERRKKYIRETKHPTHLPLRVCCEDVTRVPLSASSSPNYESDFCGFTDEVAFDKNRTLSRDSGISVQQIENTSDKEINDDIKDCKDGLHNKIQQTDLGRSLESQNTSTNQEIENVLRESAETGCNQYLQSNDSLGQQTKVNNHNNIKTSAVDELAALNETDVEITFSQDLTSALSKVQEWHAHLQPVLSQSRDRHHFDVFELGSQIMNQFDRSDINNKAISLSHIMENRDSSLISRYFLSTLLLANQGNISININSRSSEEPSELNEVELRLLSKRRNIVSLEDNIGLRTPQITVENPMQESTCTNVRTLKSFSTAPKTDDIDSGVSMSDGLSTYIDI